jgi:hypothetical protein
LRLSIVIFHMTHRNFFLLTNMSPEYQHFPTPQGAKSFAPWVTAWR